MNTRPQSPTRISRRAFSILAMLALLIQHGAYAEPDAPADEALEPPAKTLPLAGETFRFQGNPAFLIQPDNAPADKPLPWVWYAPTLPRLPGVEEKWMFERFLAAGITIAGVDVGESMGNPEGRAIYSAFHRELVTTRGLATKPVRSPAVAAGSCSTTGLSKTRKPSPPSPGSILSATSPLIPASQKPPPLTA